MEIVYNQKDLEKFMNELLVEFHEHPILVDRYIVGKELEVDAISDGENVLIPGIMEHIERAGVHSGDSIAVYPPQSLSQEHRKQIFEVSEKLCKSLKVKGLLNIQFIIANNELYVIEVNPRSSRTVPFLSKVTGLAIANIATKAILGQSLKQQNLSSGIYPESDLVSVKVPVFSFAKLHSVDVGLGPEMKSTGEVMGKDKNLAKALYKGLLASGIKLPSVGKVIATISDKDKEEALSLIRAFDDLGFEILATEGTAKFLKNAGLRVSTLAKIEEPGPNILDAIYSGEVTYILNTLTKGAAPTRDGFQIRRAAVEREIVCLTSLDTAKALLTVLQAISFSTEALQ